MFPTELVDDDLRRTTVALEEERRILEQLNRTGAKLASKLDLEEVVQEVTDTGTQVTGADFGAFFYTQTDARGGVFTLFTLSGAPRDAFEKFGHPRATPLFAPTFEGRGVIRIANVRLDPRFGQWAPHHGMPPGHLPVCSYLAIPVTSRTGEVIGGLFFGHKEPDRFTERSEQFIVGLAAQAGIAIDNARMYDEAKRAAEDRKQLLEAERAARTEIERVSLMKDEFLSTLSHELRTPLNAILGWSDLLLGRCGEADDMRRGLETISRNARSQAQLIEDLLDMSRIISGKLRLDVQPLDLATLVDAAVDSVRPSADAKAIRIRKTLDPAGSVYGDPHRVQQIVWNLLSNAVKFTPKDGTIDVLLQRVGSHVEITVTDTGNGISREFLPHIFDRFRQADSSTTRRHGGLGLGLSIVRQLVELHGGTVHAKSPGVGFGSSFILKFPIRATREVDGERHPSGRAVVPPAPLALELDGATILVVDDDADARELLRSVLLDARATVITAASADEALAIVSTRFIDVVVSDIGMPDKDGYELMRSIRKLASQAVRKVPAIAVTAFARSEDRTKALLAGYQVHIAKPIEPHELIVTIGSLIGRM